MNALVAYAVLPTWPRLLDTYGRGGLEQHSKQETPTWRVLHCGTGRDPFRDGICSRHIAISEGYLDMALPYTDKSQHPPKPSRLTGKSYLSPPWEIIHAPLALRA